MIIIEITGQSRHEIKNLVLDYNGTIAEDGELIDGVRQFLGLLGKKLKIHILTADTHGSVREKLGDLPCSLMVIGPGDEALAKRQFVKSLKSVHTAAIGNGRNDVLMLKEAALAIAVIQAEGAAPAVLGAADVLCTSIIDALNLLLKPARLKATLRN